VERAQAEEALRISERKYRQLFETMDEGFAIGQLIRGGDGTIEDYLFLELNPAVQEQTGMKKEFFLNQPMSKVVPDEAPWWKITFSEVVSSGKISRFEHYVDPLKRWFDVTAFPLEEDRFAVLYDDITERKQHDLYLEEFNQQLEHQVEKRTKELQEEHFFLEQITDNTPHLIYVFDFDEQRFIYINRRIQALTGIVPDYVYGMGPHLFKKVLHPDDLARRINYTLRLETLAESEIRESEFRIMVGEGYRWFRSKDRIFKKAGGKVQQVIGLAEDITYEILLQEKIQNEGGEMRLN
jgi:PAS domain S-box-containing protein